MKRFAIYSSIGVAMIALGILAYAVFGIHRTPEIKRLAEQETTVENLDEKALLVSSKVAEMLRTRPEEWTLDRLGVLEHQSGNISLMIFGMSLDDKPPIDCNFPHLRVYNTEIPVDSKNDASAHSQAEAILCTAADEWAKVTRFGRKYHEEVEQHEAMNRFLKENGR